MKLFLSPHNDDETLFGAFTLLRERPHVAVVFDSCIQVQRGYGDQCNATNRRFETVMALRALLGSGGGSVSFLGFADNIITGTEFREALEFSLRKFDRPEMVYAPAIEEGGHPQHNLVGEIAARVFPRVTHYLTYTNRGKSVGVPVPFELHWVARKLQALSFYGSQICLPDNVEHFLREHHEYYAE